MKTFHKELICRLAERNMNVSDVERKFQLTRRQVDDELHRIKAETGLDPLNFFDLHELYQMATSEVSE